MKVLYQKPVLVVLVFAVFVILVVGGFLGYQQFLAPEPDTPAPANQSVQPIVISAEGRVVPGRDAALAFQASGRVETIFVSPGDHVEQGQILMSLETAQVDALVAQAQAALDAAEALAAIEPESAVKERKDLLAANVQQSTAALDAAIATQNETRLLAPFSGTVVSIELEEGEVVGPGIPGVILADLTAWKVETLDLREDDVVLARVGQFAQVHIAALPEEGFAGIVSDIALSASSYQGNVTYTISIDLIDSALDHLNWGMTAFVEIGPDFEPLIDVSSPSE